MTTTVAHDLLAGTKAAESKIGEMPSCLPDSPNFKISNKGENNVRAID